jgi:hypothetical protein
MRRALILAVWAVYLVGINLVLIPAFAVEPKAALSGPASAKVKTDFFLRFAGTVADKVYLFQAYGPVDSQIDILYDRKSQPSYGVCSTSRPGSYLFVAVAYGAPASATAEPQWAFAAWMVTVTETDPTPPGPTPPPVPPVPPAPILVGKVWATAVFDLDAATMDLSPLMLGPEIRQAARENQIYYLVRYSNDPVLAANNLTPHLKGVKLPVVIVQNEAGHVVTDPPRELRDQASIVAYFKSLRGK